MRNERERPNLIEKTYGKPTASIMTSHFSQDCQGLGVPSHCFCSSQWNERGESQ